nr:helix-turn-helix transcriptional regulator [Nakamurella aerolata]
MAAATTAAQRAATLAATLAELVAAADPRRLATAREVAGIARAAEVDRSIRSAVELARPAGLSVRTLQRLFAEYAGASPTWVIRRYRLIDAAERVRAGESVVWADVAAELGYADQAHLTRDFSRALGSPPSAYQQAQRRPR